MLLVFSMVIAMPMVQTNSIAAQVDGLGLSPDIALGPVTLDVFGLVIAALVGVVVFGGVRQIARVAEWMTP